MRYITLAALIALASVTGLLALLLLAAWIAGPVTVASATMGWVCGSACVVCLRGAVDVLDAIDAK